MCFLFFLKGPASAGSLSKQASSSQTRIQWWEQWRFLSAGFRVHSEKLQLAPSSTTSFKCRVSSGFLLAKFPGGWNCRVENKAASGIFQSFREKDESKFSILPHSKPAQKWGSQRDPGLGSSSLISLVTDDSKMGCFSVFVRSLLADPWKCYVQLKELQRVMCWGKMLLLRLICLEQAACLGLWLMSQMCGFCRVFLIRLKMVSSQLP